MSLYMRNVFHGAIIHTVGLWCDSMRKCRFVYSLHGIVLHMTIHHDSLHGRSLVLPPQGSAEWPHVKKLYFQIGDFLALCEYLVALFEYLVTLCEYLVALFEYLVTLCEYLVTL